MRTPANWRIVEKAFLGGLFGAFAGAFIFRQLMSKVGDAYKLPALVMSLLLPIVLGAFLSSGGLTNVPHWIRTATRQVLHWIRTATRQDVLRIVTALLQVILAVQVAVVLAEFVGIPLCTVLLATGWGFWNKRSWVGWLGGWTHGFLLVGIACVAIALVVAKANRQWAVQLILPIAVSCWTLWYVKGYQRECSLGRVERTSQPVLLRFLGLTAMTSIVGSIPLAGLVGLVFRFPIPFAGYESGPEAFARSMFAAIFFGVSGGLVVQAVMGFIGGLFAYQLASNRADQANRIIVFCGICAALPRLLVLATLDWIIGPW